MSTKQADFDVVIIGAGPAGSTLAALLARQSDLRVCLLEKEAFPREHIGESFSHRLIPLLAESGALEHVLASDCWIRKYGGYYSWDPERPYATFFEHHASREDGLRRWAIHVDRARFDDILLRHAESLGVQIETSWDVVGVTHGEPSRVEARDGRSFSATIVVEASGRRRSLVSDRGKAFLSAYKNIAIWQHIVDGKPAQSLPGEWNIFREDDLSAIGSFAFEDGWFWYIPVPRVHEGERVLTHSLGLVTDPEVLARKNYREPGALLEAARSVPLLRELVGDARPLYDEVKTATNYSMIAGRFCDFDQRWILIGDSAHFVDPLFSSGVTFAVLHAASAALLIRTYFDAGLGEAQKRELWDDYEQDWGLIARSFALAIDQWYHAISLIYPDSAYWRPRAEDAMVDGRNKTFHALVNTEFSTDLLHVLTRSTDDVARLDERGPLAQKLADIRVDRPADDEVVRLRPDVELREGLAIQAVRSTVAAQKNHIEERASRFWADPKKRPGEGWIYDAPAPCHRLVFAGDDADDDRVRLRFTVEDGGLALYERLRAGARFGELVDGADPHQRLLLNRIWRAGMLEREGAAPG